MLAMAGLNTRRGAEMAAWAANDSVKTATIAGRPAPQSVIDEVIWVVGDEPILKSEVEITRLQSEAEGIKWDGDPDCQIPEQIAVQKLFLHQAALDSIEVTESEINQAVDQQINYWLSLPTIDGSRERLEQYQRKTISQMRQDMHDDFRDRQLVQKEQQELVKDIEVSPAEVRAYFTDMPTDSLPEIPTTVEVQILTKNPIIEQEEVNRVKNQLREFTERVTKKETSFATLARLYSEDKGTARQGGELGYTGRGLLDPAFANAAFNLTDPNKISKIVETEFGYHIIQLLPTEVAAVVDTMKVGQVSKAFRMTTDRGKVTTAIVRLMARTDAHKANIQEDFQAMSDIVTSHARQKKIHEWVVKKIKDTYVWISPQYRGCNFQYEGWVR